MTMADRNDFLPGAKSAVILLMVLLLLGAAAGPHSDVFAADNSPPGRKIALLIGIQDYIAFPQGDWLDLPGCENDVENIRTVLASQYGFTDIRILKDRDATRENMLAALRKLVAEAGPQDTVFIHFSGHGSQVQDLNSDDADDNLDETLLAADARMDGVPDIVDDELGRILDRLQAQNAVVVLDSCHSGTATRGGGTPVARYTGVDERVELYRGIPECTAAAPSAAGKDLILPARTNYVLITAAGPHQNALSVPRQGQPDVWGGLLTFALLDAFKEATPMTTYGELIDQVDRNVKSYALTYHLSNAPQPRLEAGEGADNWPVLNPDREMALAPTVPVREVKGDSVILGAGSAFGVVVGSVYLVFAADATRFDPGEEMGAIQITEVNETQARARVLRGDSAKMANGRALEYRRRVAVAPVYVRVEGQEPELLALKEALNIQNDRYFLARRNGFANFIVQANPDGWTILGADGLSEMARIPAPAQDPLEALAPFLEQAATGMAFLAMTRHNPNLVVEINTLKQPPDYRPLPDSAPPSSEGCLQFEVTNRSGRECFITVIEISPAGMVAQIFPNRQTERFGYHPRGLLKPGEKIAVPDRNDRPNAAGFVWRVSEPTGTYRIKVIATNSAGEAEKIRAQLQAMEERQAATGSSRGAGSPAAGLAALADSLNEGGDSGENTRGAASSAVEWSTAETFYTVTTP